MNRRLVADFLLQLQDTAENLVERELRQMHASRATMAAFQTAVNMKNIGGWNSMAEWCMANTTAHPDRPALTPVAYEPTAAERQAWSVQAISCNEV